MSPGTADALGCRARRAGQAWSGARIPVLLLAGHSRAVGQGAAAARPRRPLRRAREGRRRLPPRGPRGELRAFRGAAPVPCPPRPCGGSTLSPWAGAAPGRGEPCPAAWPGSRRATCRGRRRGTKHDNRRSASREEGPLKGDDAVQGTARLGGRTTHVPDLSSPSVGGTHCPTSSCSVRGDRDLARRGCDPAGARWPSPTGSCHSPSWGGGVR